MKLAISSFWSIPSCGQSCSAKKALNFSMLGALQPCIVRISFKKLAVSILSNDPLLSASYLFQILLTRLSIRSVSSEFTENLWLVYWLLFWSNCSLVSRICLLPMCTVPLPPLTISWFLAVLKSSRTLSRESVAFSLMRSSSICVKRTCLPTSLAFGTFFWEESPLIESSY